MHSSAIPLFATERRRIHAARLMPQSDSAISRLNTDALALIFSAVREETPSYNQRTALRPLLTLTHVCRSWRALALAQPRLWTAFFWEPGNNVEAALTILERSRSALLTMKISLEPKNNPRTPGALISEGHVVFAAAAAHFWRTTDLTLTFSTVNVRAGVLSVLFSDNPCAMSRLRNLSIEACGATDIPHVNIECLPLCSISLVRIAPLTWPQLFGAATTMLHLRGLSLRASVLRRVLELSPNLHELNVYFCNIDDDQVGAQTGIAVTPRFAIFHVFGLQLADFLLLKSLVPIAPIQEVFINTVFMDIPADVAYDFLRIADLVDIKYLNVTEYQLAVATTAGQERIMNCDSVSLDDLGDLFSTGAISTTLRELSIALELFMDLIILVAGAGDEPSLPQLEKLTLWVSQSSFERDNDAVHDGPPVLAPSLALVEVCLHGSEMPTADLVRHFIACMVCIRATSLGDDAFTIADHHGEGNSHLHRFGELFREETWRSMAGVPYQQ